MMAASDNPDSHMPAISAPSAAEKSAPKIVPAAEAVTPTTDVEASSSTSNKDEAGAAPSGETKPVAPEVAPEKTARPEKDAPVTEVSPEVSAAEETAEKEAGTASTAESAEQTAGVAADTEARKKAAASPRLTLGLSPGASDLASLLGGVTPAFGSRDLHSKDRHFEFHGMVFLPLRFGISSTASRPSGG